MQAQQDSADARLLAVADQLDARLDTVCAAPGLPWTTRDVAEVVRDLIAVIRAEISR